MKMYDSNIYGQIPCPSDFTELLSLISEDKKKSSINVSFWRGQSNIEWKIDPGAVRRLRLTKNNNEESDNIRESNIIHYETGLIQRARKNLFDFDSHNRQITDFELLARLQHNGAATRLVDFSKSALIGLFFCISNQQYDDKYGLLCGIHTSVIGGHEDRYIFSFSYEEFTEFIKDKENEHIIAVSPPPISNRIAAQHAILLYSKYADGVRGSLYLEEDDENYKFIAISPELKKECNYYLTSSFDITRATMFPDLSGFCEINSVDWEQYAHFRW